MNCQHALAMPQKNIFEDDLRRVLLAQEPKVTPDMDLVWVLAGRTSVLGGNVDKLNRAFDPNDDYLRVMRGIEIADEINALRAGKAVQDLTDEDRVTPIFYNGRTDHNQDLEEALITGKLKYPAKLFKIAPISPENTIGQIKGFKTA
ncbi:MAG: hypothetical protein QNK11_04465 [Legionella sp.]|nr:hypothetical protein [Legionella sp.]